MMAPLVRLDRLEKSVAGPAGRTWLLRRISFAVEAGEFVTVMGPSGAGKSTLLHVLGMLDGDWEGGYEFDGRDVAALAAKQRNALHKANLGLVFQQHHLLDDLTVAENLDVPLSYRDLAKPERQALVADALDRFGIVGKKDLYPSQLSGGQQQLVGVARAVILKPKLLLADEPTGNLHSDQAREIMALFQRLNAEGTTIVQVTHSEENAGYGRRILRLKDGWLVSDEPSG